MNKVTVCRSTQSGLNVPGASRCPTHNPSCSSACSPMGSDQGTPPEWVADNEERERCDYDDFLDTALKAVDLSTSAKGGR